MYAQSHVVKRVKTQGIGELHNALSGDVGLSFVHWDLFV